MRRAHAGQTAGHDLAALGNKLREQAHVLVVNGFDLLGAEFAHLLAPEEFPSARTTGSAFPSPRAGTRGTPLA